MRIHLAILAAMSLMPAVTAQHINWDMHPGQTSFTSRGNIGSGSGAIFQGVHQNTSRGVLDINGKSAITQLNTISQDQNGGTQEKYGYVVRLGTDANGPGTTTGAVLGTVTGLITPPRTNNNGWAFSITTTLRSPITVPSTKHWSYGIQLPRSPNWVADGFSTHAARGAPSSAPRHHSHGKQEDQAWQIIGTATMARNVSNKRSWRISARRLGAAVMKLRCGGRAGYGGSFPIASVATAALAWDARLQGGTAASGASSVVALGIVRTGGFGPIGTAANLYLSGPLFLFFGPSASTSGTAVVKLLPFVPASAAGAGRFPMQGLLANSRGLFMLTNSQTVIP